MARRTQKKSTQKEGVKGMTTTGATGAGQVGEELLTELLVEDSNDMLPIKDGTEVELQGGVIRVDDLPNVNNSLTEAELRQQIAELKAQLETYQTADVKAEVAVDPEPPVEAPTSHHCTCPDCGGPMTKGN